MATRASLLEAFRVAHAKWRASGGTRIAADESPALDVARDILAAIGESALAIEAIRTDPELAAHPEYRALWKLAPLGAGEEAGIAAETSAIDLGRATSLLAMASLESTRLAMLDTHEGRRRALDALPDVLAERRKAPKHGDQRLIDGEYGATVPPVPAYLTAYPQLQPPFYDAAAGSQRTFSMTLHYPDQLEAVGGRPAHRLQVRTHPGSAGPPEPDRGGRRGIRAEVSRRAGSPSTGRSSSGGGATPRMTSSGCEVNALEDWLGPQGEVLSQASVVASHAIATIGDVVCTTLGQAFKPAFEARHPPRGARAPRRPLEWRNERTEMKLVKESFAIDTSDPSFIHIQFEQLVDFYSKVRDMGSHIWFERATCPGWLRRSARA